MTDFTWYSRLLIWIGAAIFVMDLLAEGILNRSLGFALVIAVVCLIAGLAGFVLGLAIDARPITLIAEAAASVPHYGGGEHSEPTEVRVSPSSALIVAEGPLPATAERATPPKVAPATVPAPTTLEPAEPTKSPVRDPVDSAPRVEPESIPPAAPPARAASGAISEDVGPGSGLAQAICPSCHEPLRVGQVAAVCATCGGVHHATCWVGNHFHCARDGCAGQGNLVAPAAGAPHPVAD